MSAQATADRALQALATGLFSQDLLNALTSLSPSDRSDLLENGLLQVLANTNDRKVRNASALALADLNSQIAPQVIRGLLTSLHTRGSRATLLYALREMGGKLSLPLLVGLITNETGETRQEALIFLEQGLIEPVSEPDKRAAVQQLIDLINKEPSARVGDVFDAIEMLSAMSSA